jgi:hypothetical protein
VPRERYRPLLALNGHLDRRRIDAELPLESRLDSLFDGSIARPVLVSGGEMAYGAGGWASYPSLNVTPSCSPNQGCDELESNVTQQLMGLRGSPSMRMTATRRSGKRALGAVTARPSAGTGTPFGCRLPGR